MRKCYPSKEAALVGALEQLAKIDIDGPAQSVEDANSRHAAYVSNRIAAAQKDRELMKKLGDQIKSTPLTPEEMSNIVYPKGRK